MRMDGTRDHRQYPAAQCRLYVLLRLSVYVRVHVYVYVCVLVRVLVYFIAFISTPAFEKLKLFYVQLIKNVRQWT